jgi:hypothetical protein
LEKTKQSRKGRLPLNSGMVTAVFSYVTGPTFCLG